MTTEFLIKDSRDHSHFLIVFLAPGSEKSSGSTKLANCRKKKIERITPRNSLDF